MREKSQRPCWLFFGRPFVLGHQAPDPWKQLTLAAGQTVTTGTCLVPLEFEPQDTVSIDFGVLGQVSCSFSAA